MSIIYALLLCLAIPGFDPTVDGELHIAASSLEERLSTQPTLSVSYRIHTEWTEFGKKAKRPPPPDLVATWNRDLAKESFLIRLKQDPQYTLKQWYYDGKTTHEWLYEQNSDRIKHIAVNQGEPRDVIRYSNTLAFILGWETYQAVPGGLASIVQTARRDRTVVGRSVSGGLEIDFGAHSIKNVQYQFIATVDSAHDYRLQSWLVRAMLPGKPPEERFQFVVDEFQGIPDGLSGANVWFPLRAHTKTLGTVSQIEVTSVRLNHQIPDSAFVSPDPPFGTTIQEISTLSGETHETLVGGEAARQQKVEELAREAKIELDRLDREGVSFDATPPDGLSGVYGWVLGVCLILIALVCWMVRRTRK